MTASNSQSIYQAPRAPDPLVRTFHIACALGVCDATLGTLIKEKRLPAPTVEGPARTKMWRLSALRAANSELADSVEILLKLPRIAAV